MPLPSLSDRPLVGRSSDVRAVLQLIVEDGARLVTLVGPGGVGKTRLAVAVSEGLRERFTDGVFFVDLAPVRDAGLVLGVVAEALDIHDVPPGKLTAAIVDRVGDGRVLLVIDNFEQVLDAAHGLPRLLAECPELAILASSREPLGSSWEQQFQVAPLVPDAAIELFVQHARTVRPSLSLSHAHAETVREICRRLDGLPLAIELAAARLRVLSPDAVLGQLRQRPLSLLTGGARDAPERHRTLRESIAVSYAMLSGPEQVLLRGLSVFVAGCSLEALNALEIRDPAEVPLETLEALVDKHLVRIEEHQLAHTDLPPGADEPSVRVRLLETIREFGLEQLAAQGELDLAHGAMMRWLVDLAERAEPALYGAEQLVWIERLAREHDNVRAALDWCVRGGDIDGRGHRSDASVPESGLRLAGALWLFWRVRGFVREGRARLADVLARSTEPTRARGRALYAAGYLAFASGAAEEARPLLEESRRTAEAVGDAWTRGYALQGLGHVELLNGNLLRADALYAERLNVARAEADDYGLAQAWNALGEVARCMDEPSRARDVRAELEAAAGTW